SRVLVLLGTSRIAQRLSHACTARRTIALAKRTLGRIANRSGRCAQTAQEGKSPCCNTCPTRGGCYSRLKRRSRGCSGPDEAGNGVGRSQFLVSQSRLYQLPSSPRPIDDAAAPRWLHHRGG